MTLDLTDDEERALVQLLRRTLDFDPFPHAPRLDPLKAILAKLEPPAPKPQRLAPLRPGMGPTPGRDGAGGEAHVGLDRTVFGVGAVIRTVRFSLKSR